MRSRVARIPSGRQLSPAITRARFEALLTRRAINKNADDPLFRPVDADDFREHGDEANDYSNLVENGLVCVTLPLPPNVRIIDRTPAQRRTRRVTADGRDTGGRLASGDAGE